MSENRSVKHRSARRPLAGMVQDLTSNSAVKRISILAGSSIAITGVIAAGIPTQPVTVPANSINASQLAKAALEKASTNPTVETANEDELLPAIQASVGTAPAPQEAVEPEEMPAVTVRAQGNQAQAQAQAQPVQAAQPVQSPAEVSNAAVAPADGSIAAIASQFAGTRYVWGGTSPAGFDCSGFVQYVYGLKGIRLPHQSGGIAAAGTRIPVSEAQPGDVLWHPGHVAIYLGNGRIIHASTPRTGVVYGTVRGMGFTAAIRF